MADQSSTQDAARNRANRDFNAGRLPANSSNWDTPMREAHDAEVARRQREQNNKSSS